MNPALLIAKKRDGEELTGEEIEAFIDGFSRGQIPDYQMAAMAMAIYCRGMTTDETAALTDAMLASGVRLPRAGARPRVDKHSTGGIGDKTSLILAPLLACCGLAVPMISGRGLGATGGTLDKLARAKGATPGQVALAWLLKRSPVMLPIPGTSKVAHLEENVATAAIKIDDATFQELNKLASKAK